MSVLEIHVWGSDIKHLEVPDRLSFDLDPGDGVSWDQIRDAAVELKERFAAMKLTSFVKTSGGKGLHVVVPIMPEANWDIAKAFCKTITQQMALESPLRYVATMSKSRRSGRIFKQFAAAGSKPHLGKHIDAFHVAREIHCARKGIAAIRPRRNHTA